MTVPTVLLHGFTQTGNVWRWPPLWDLLPDDVLTPDLPAHGRCAPGHDHDDLWAVADYIASICGRANYVGYSFGGRVALHIAARYPQKVESLCVIGASTGIADTHERAKRVASDESLAQQLETMDKSQLRRWLVDDWLKRPLFDGLSVDAQQLDERLENSGPRLASHLRSCGTGMQQDLTDAVREFDMPVLALCGEYDSLQARQSAQRIAELAPNGRMHVVPGAHHSIPWQNPTAFVNALR